MNLHLKRSGALREWNFPDFLKILVVLEHFLAFGFQNPVLIVMVQRIPNTNIIGIILVIDVIKVANAFFPMANLKVMGFRTDGKTIGIVMLFHDF